MHICIFEDAQFKNFLPLVYLRPVFDLRCGALNLRDRILQFTPKAGCTLFVRPELAATVREDSPKMSVNDMPDADCWFINGRLLADVNLSALLKRPQKKSMVFLSGDQLVAVFILQSDLHQLKNQLSRYVLDRAMFAHLPSEFFECSMMHYPWDLVHSVSSEILHDFKTQKRNTGNRKAKIYAGAHILNKRNVILGAGSVIKPGAVLDAENGPIIIGENVTIMSNAVIEGPAFIGDHSVIKIGAKIYHGTSIGPWCKVGGEVEASIIHSYSNKQHDGFLGHSYIGSWVNLGADTNTSDLKNTYGNVKVQMENGLVDTGKQFVGLTMGDHSKTGINVMFDTGANVGVACNVFGAGMPPKSLPSFSWGGDSSYVSYDLGKSIETARKVMARRGINMSDSYAKLLQDAFLLTQAHRRKAGIR